MPIPTDISILRALLHSGALAGLNTFRNAQHHSTFPSRRFYSAWSLILTSINILLAMFVLPFLGFLFTTNSSVDSSLEFDFTVFKIAGFLATLPYILAVATAIILLPRFESVIERIVKYSEKFNEE